MQNSNQSDQNTQQQGSQKDSAWRGSSPEDVTGKQSNQGNEAKQTGEPGQDNQAKQAGQSNQANQTRQPGQVDQPAMEHGRPEQGNPNNAMGNAANRPWEQNKEQNKEQKKDEKKMPNDTDEMGSGKRQDDN